MFAALVSFGLDQCTDGTSNTIAFGEKVIGDNTAATNNGGENYNCIGWPSGTDSGRGSAADQAMPMGLTFLNQYVTLCDAARAAGTANQTNGQGSVWATGRMIEGPLLTELQTPNSPHADCFNFAQNTGMTTFRSRHSGGVNALMGDGSVKFIKNGVTRGPGGRWVRSRATK